MELISHEIAVKTRQSTEILLMPIGDIQWTGMGGDTTLDMLKRHVAWGVEHGAYFLGMGDYIDFASPSNRHELQAAKLYDSARQVIDDAAQALVRELYEVALKPSRGRWLGMLEGHHYSQYRDGTTSDQHLCKLLDAPFLGTSAYVRLMFRRTKTCAGSVLIWCHHGVGGGRRLSGPLNQLETLPAYWDGDIFLIGHHTKKVGAPLDRVEPLYCGNGRTPVLLHRTKVLACTGGFMAGYQVGRKDGRVPRGNYVEQKMLNPTALGGVLVKIRPRWMGVNRHDVWVPDLSIEQ